MVAEKLCAELEKKIKGDDFKVSMGDNGEVNMSGIGLSVKIEKTKNSIGLELASQDYDSVASAFEGRIEK